jgi:hypothetical protein
MRPKINSFLTLAAVALSLSSAACGQTARPRIGKSEAVKSVKVASLDGWKEAVSDEGRFRILFHGEPVASHDPGGKGFEMKGDRVKWFALYYDYNNSFDDDDATLRQKYAESVEALTKRGSKLLSRREVTLNGRPGVEFILLGQAAAGQVAKSYMRAFQVGRRLYTLAVDDYKDVSESNAVPAEVQSYFDSFTFWE